MNRKVILVDHPVGKRDDRASRMIAERGFDLAWCNPGRGEPLPDLGEEVAAVVVYGGAENLSEIHERCYLHEEIDWLGRCLAEERPVLGICLGAQLLARALGAEVRKHPEGLHEIGYYEISPTAEGRDFLPTPMHVYHWHQEGFEVPADAVRLAAGETFKNQAFRYGESAFGLQFHPEVSPQVFQRWIQEAGHMLASPGAHSAERQRRDAEHHDEPMRDWFEGFLDRWLGRAEEA